MNWIKTRSCFFMFTLTNVIHFSRHQFHSNVIAFKQEYFFKNKDIFRYNSRARKNFKKLKNYSNYVQDHHCIPREHRDHSLLKTLDFDVNCSKNIYIMPTKKGKYILNLHPETMVHEGGHHHYNKFVKENLDEINTKSEYDEKKYEFWLFLMFLKSNLKFNNDNIPWK